MMAIRFGSAMLIAAGMLVLAPGISHAQKRQRDRITREEIMNSAHKDLDLFQVIRSLRPRFLEGNPGVRSFGNSSAAGTPIAVFVDGRRDTGLDALKSIDALKVEEVRYLDPDRSASEYGPAAAGGAILVKMVKEKPPGEGS
jgi:hypothetical protein